MKPKINVFLLILLAIVVATAGCSDSTNQMDEEPLPVEQNNDENEDAEEEENEENEDDETDIFDCDSDWGDELTGLKGTVWKYVGLVNHPTTTNPTGALKEPVGFEDCDDCFTLWFNTDHTISAIGITQRVMLDLHNNVLPYWAFLKTSGTSETGSMDAILYCKFLQLTFSYTYTASSKELKLFQSNFPCEKFTYLLFKQIDRAPPVSLTGTKWKLSGMVDTQTGIMRELEPKNCDECYTIEFGRDSVGMYQSIWARQWRDFLNLKEKDDPTRPGNYFVDEPLGPEIYQYNEHFYPYGDGKTYDDSILYRSGIAFAEAYELANDELKLFFVYQEKLYYFLFKCILK